MKLIYLIGVRPEIDQHTNQIKGTDLREVRPRAGRSPWRALYQRDAGQILVAAISPEAQHDTRGFQRAINVAHTRLQEYKSGEVEDD